MGSIGAYEFAEVRAVQVLEDVEEAVDEEGVVLDELVVLGHLAWRQQPQLRVDRLVPLHRRLPRHHSGIRLNQIPAGRRRVSPRPRRVREWGRRRRRLVAGSAASGEEAAPGWARRGAGEMVGEVEVFECYLYGRMVVIWWWARLEKFMLLSPVLSWEVVLQIDTCGTRDCYLQHSFPRKFAD